MEAATSSVSPLPGAAVIYHLTIERFRGIKSLSWYPSKGVNVILGGGDVGKTTILDAVALLLSPTNPGALSDTDYHAREIATGFTIEAVLSLPTDSDINHQVKPSWPWEWNGKEAVVPKVDTEGAMGSEPVYRLRVRGTEDLEPAFEIVQPDGTTDSLPVALRRSIGLVRLGGDDRNDRDLRLVQGSALDRLLSDKALRSRMASELSKTVVKDKLLAEGQKALTELDEAFKEAEPTERSRPLHHRWARSLHCFTDRPDGRPCERSPPSRNLGSRHPAARGPGDRGTEPGRVSNHGCRRG